VKAFFPKLFNGFGTIQGLIRLHFNLINLQQCSFNGILDWVYGYWPHLHNLQFVAIGNLATLPYGLPHGSHCLVGLSQGLGQVGWSKLPNLLLASHNVGKRVPFLSHSPKWLFFWWAKNWTFWGHSLFCIFRLKYAFVDSKTFIILTKI